MELTDYVYAFPLTFERGDREMIINPSGIETEGGLILFDAGFPGEVDTLAEALAEHGFSLDDIGTLFLTHQDGDHVGGATDLLDRTDATVVASTGDTPAIEGDEELVKSDRYPPVSVDVQVVDGVTFRTEAGPARVVETPGHTPGHVSLVLPDAELLIAGDAMTADGNGLQGPDEQFTPEMETAVDSVGKLAAFDTNRTLCYHGGFVEDADVEAVYQSLTD